MKSGKAGEAVNDDPSARIAHVAMAKVRVLSGAGKGRYDRDVMHLSLEKAREGEALGIYEILDVKEPGMPSGGSK